MLLSPVDCTIPADEREKMLAIVRAANPLGMQRHYHYERLQEEYRRKHAVATQPIATPTTQ